MNSRWFAMPPDARLTLPANGKHAHPTKAYEGRRIRLFTKSAWASSRSIVALGRDLAG